MVARPLPIVDACVVAGVGWHLVRVSTPATTLPVDRCHRDAVRTPHYATCECADCVVVALCVGGACRRSEPQAYSSPSKSTHNHHFHSSASVSEYSSPSRLFGGVSTPGYSTSRFGGPDPAATISPSRIRSPTSGAIAKLTEELDLVRRAWRHEGGELRAKMVSAPWLPYLSCVCCEGREGGMGAGNVPGCAVATRLRLRPPILRFARECGVWVLARCVVAPLPRGSSLQLEVQQEKIRAEERVFALESEVCFGRA